MQPLHDMTRCTTPAQDVTFNTENKLHLCLHLTGSVKGAIGRTPPKHACRGQLPVQPQCICQPSRPDQPLLLLLRQHLSESSRQTAKTHARTHARTLAPNPIVQVPLLSYGIPSSFLESRSFGLLTSSRSHPSWHTPSFSCCCLHLQHRYEPATEPATTRKRELESSLVILLRLPPSP